MGEDCSTLKTITSTGYFASYIIHSEHEGIFNELSIDEFLRDKIINMELYVKEQQSVYPFNGSQFGLGAMTLTFNSMQEMLETMHRLPKLVRVVLAETTYTSL